MSKRKSRKASSRSSRRDLNVPAPVSLPTPESLEQALREHPSSLPTALSLAQYYSDHGQADKIADILEAFENKCPHCTTWEREQYSRLLAFGYAHSKRWSEAERVLTRALAEFPEDPDLLYCLTYVYLSLREFEKAIRAGENFCSHYRPASPSTPGDGVIPNSPDKAAHVLNYLGIAYLEMARFTEATAAFERSIATDSGLHLAYLNLAGLYRRQNNLDEARRTVERGLHACRQVQELRLLAQGLMRRSTVSACLMVRNEEELLPGCLESLRDWVDEIVVVDTGSTDRTMEIARSYGAKVYQHPWENSFSKSRNFTLQYATSEWQLVIDADERVYTEDIPQIVEALNRPDVDVVTLNVYNVYEEHRDVIVFLPSHRLFRRSLNVHYEGIVHNQLCVPASARYCRIGARIRHLGYGLSREKMEAKADRTRKLLEQQLAENPDNAFALFNYAQLLRSHPDGFKIEYADKILQAAGRAIVLTDPTDPATRHLHLMCLDQLAWTHYYLGNHDQSLEFARRALDAKPDYLDPLLLSGYLYFKKQDLTRAAEYFEKYLNTQLAYDPSKELENIILIHLNARSDALFNLGAIAELRSDRDLARRYYRETLLTSPNHPDANLNYSRLLLADGNLGEAESCLVRLIESGKPTPDIFLSLSRLHRERKEDARGLAVLEQARSQFPGANILRIEEADYLIEAGRLDDAASLLRVAHSSNPSDLTIVSRLTDTLSRAGNFHEAIELLKAVSRHTALSAELLNDLGNCYYRIKDFSLAATSYEDALGINPLLAAARRNLGLALARLGRPDEAISCLSAFLEEAPDQTELFHIVADLYCELKNWPSALAAYEKYLRRYPTDTRALCRLSDCYLYMGHADSAILGYQRVLQLEPEYGPALQRLAKLESASDRSPDSTPAVPVKLK